MADDGIAAEIVSTAVIEEVMPPSEIQPVIDAMKSSGSELDPDDSRSTNPDGAQSPASSTYADCEETDTPNSTNAEKFPTKNDSVSEVVQVVISDVEQEVGPESPAKSEESNENEKTDQVKEFQVSTNGEVEKECETKEENKVDAEADADADYEYVDSGEDYEVGGQSADGYESHDSQEENNRENGDGEEVNEDDAAQKKLDHDEDRRNPQYIPKRGFFYEHDDRTADTGVEGEATATTKEVTAPELESKRKGRRSVPDGRWMHDMYKEDEQHSKSAQELINVYGYDIRNEESAPKARRRRKYGRGPTRNTRKWDDESGPVKQTGRAFRAKQQKPLPVQREEYNAEFPSLDRQPAPKPKSHEQRPKSPAPPKPNRNQDMARNDGHTKYKDERRRSPPRKFNSDHVERSSRSFTKRIPTSTPAVSTKVDHSDVPDDIHAAKPAPVRTKFVVNNSFVNSSRGRGVPQGKPMTRNVNTNDFVETAHPPPEPRMQFLPANRGRARRLDKPCPNQGFYMGKTSNDDEMRHLTEQIATVDLRGNRNAVNRNDVERRAIPSEITHEQSGPANCATRSKRYSYQRQRPLPESSNEKSAMDAGMHALNAMHSVSERGGVTNMMQTVSENNALHQVSSVSVSHNSVPMIAENQLTTAPPSNTSLMSVNAAPMQSNSLAVSAPMIPLSAPPLTASGAALQAAAPSLPIMGYFQHPQGYSNQATTAQVYTREQNMMTAQSNQPVQLVAFLPASPMISNTNHTPAATATPPPPPPPPTYPANVISYPQASPTQQTQPSFTSESYSMPPVTLAPIHQEVYQSRGGVTYYYNTRPQVKPRSPPPPRVKTAIPIVPPPSEN